MAADLIAIKQISSSRITGMAPLSQSIGQKADVIEGFDEVDRIKILA